MSAVRRPKAIDAVLDLTRRLAEEFDAIPVPMVTDTVKSAVAAVRLFGDDVVESLPTVERLAREDLAALRDAAREQSAVAVAG